LKSLEERKNILKPALLARKKWIYL
jgi:hypothetical protein